MKNVTRGVAAAALLLLPTAVLATVVVGETIEEMARASTAVVRGRVLQVQPQYDESKGMIVTYADVQVVEVLKGRPMKSVLVKQPGGELNGRGTQVAGAGKFVKGQDTVLFLEAAVDEPGVFILRALSAGKVDLETSKLGELRAVRHLGGIAFADKTGIREVQPEESFGSPDAFLARVRAALKGGGR